jgi:hypothetical membrane protein
MKSTRLIVLLPLVSGLWLATGVIIAGALRPGYDHASQFMSELGATGTPGAWAMNYLGFIPTELFFLAFLMQAAMACRREPLMLTGFAALNLYALSLIIAAVFSCDAGCRPQDPSFGHQIHIVTGLAAYLLALTGIAVLAVASGRAGAKIIQWTGLATTAIGLIAFTQLTPDNPLAGAFQRGLEASLYTWFVLLAIHLARRDPIPVSEQTGNRD